MLWTHPRNPEVIGLGCGPGIRVFQNSLDESNVQPGLGALITLSPLSLTEILTSSFFPTPKLIKTYSSGAERRNVKRSCQKFLYRKKHTLDIYLCVNFVVLLPFSSLLSEDLRRGTYSDIYVWLCCSTFLLSEDLSAFFLYLCHLCSFIGWSSYTRTY